jgi:hypothetical protein
MSEAIRIPLRLLGLALFAGSLAGVVYIVGVGPEQVGEQMGQNCRRSKTGPEQYCTWQDALSIMQALPWICLIGGVLLVAMQRGWVGRDKGGETAPAAAPAPTGLISTGSGGGIVHALAGLAVIVLIVVNFAGVTVYRAGYTVKTTKDVAEKILRDTPRPDLSGRNAPKPASAPVAPRGLGKGSLLRAGAFRAAMAEIRRAAPAGARLSALRVAADRIDAEVIAGGRVVTLRRAWNAKAAVEDTAAATGESALITFSRLAAAAPRRAVLAAAKARGASPRDVGYLVLFDAVGLRWNAYLAEGAGQVSVSPDGRQVR